ncbi:MAG: helix-turn-helix domain-containing protein [Anaerolineales bacterium]|nr:helix-turn-helix domain-containing protein [Anaerolineales bacterium]
MNDELFSDLLESVREGGTILRGEKPASRTFVIEPLDVKRIREAFKLSQSEFAAVLGIRIKTLQNWEQGRRAPQGPARVLLQVAARHPEAVWDVVRSP